MELLEKLITPLIVAIFMFIMNRNQKKRDEKEAEAKLKKEKNEQQHMKQHQFQTKGMLLLVDSNKLALESLKKLKDEKGKALLNGELTAINRKVSDFKEEFETFIIEK